MKNFFNALKAIQNLTAGNQFRPNSHIPAPAKNPPVGNRAGVIGAFAMNGIAQGNAIPSSGTAIERGKTSR
jgi:hypothetical protein